jgi:hypothetical protein
MQPGLTTTGNLHKPQIVQYFAITGLVKTLA